MAGLRTHALVAVVGAVSIHIGMGAYIAALLMIGALAVAGYMRNDPDDLGLTGEVALLVNMALAGLAWLQLPAPPTPSVGVLPVPTLLLVGGLLGGVGLAAVSRVVAARGARRRVHTISLRLRDRIGQVARTQLVEPVQAVLARHRATREQLDAALEA